MRLIVISSEYFFEGESIYINKLFECGLSVLHLRKPVSTKEELTNLIRQIDTRYHSKIVLHDHFELINDFALKGVHLNKRNPHFMQTAEYSVSYSCHTLKEIENLKNYSYAFLSPIFDSISKTGYAKAFTVEELVAAKEKGIINEKIIALGGISPENIHDIHTLGFGGVAVLGYLWKNIEEEKENINLFIKRFNELKYTCENL